MEIFPYPSFRPFQEDIYRKVYDSLRNGVPALINAPTGLGKTAAVLAAAVKFTLETGIPIHYAVRTRAELEPPVRELSKMRKKGVEVDYVVIKSRQDMCCYPQLRKLSYLEFLAECSYLRKTGKCAYYPPMEVDAPLRSVSAYVKFLCAASSCPYEYAKKKLRDAKILISTYYYVFSKEGADVRKRVVIIDEAHSVFDAVVQLHGFKLNESEIRQAYSEARKYGFVEEAAKIYRLYAFVRKTTGTVDIGDLLSLIADLDLDEVIGKITALKIERRSTPYTPLLLLKELKEALRTKTRLYAEVEETGGSKVLALYPLDPATVVREALRGAYAVVYLSGTLPVELFAQNLGLTKYEKFDVPFNAYVPRENYLTIIDVGVTTRYAERGEEMYFGLAKRLATLINLSPRGILAVFPSYEVMKGVRKYLKISIPHWYEDSGEVAEELPDKFFIGAVARGRYTEGVEYTRDGENLLSTVAIVGVPFPEPSPYLERRVEILRPKLREKAWEAVYLYEAVVGIRQAVGRLFRGPGDRGVIALLDRRYAEPDLWGQLSDLTSGATIVGDVEEAEESIRKFFNAVL
ncbi:MULTISPECIES: ATP-dependent DNA helicase [Pyrobaculum]|uniref:DEAD_2 domain protein n=2 Tax=Pyrobaculum arsenaticum TaxID=121277 RepID=A4WKK3_PYRAR|nr:ATP-dependent DNA helicase [Pyrobaculum arsenaticum]ABP50920.1 DEAD_2 domain protein [Pyrobaculum arsenaticum DSM 13514]MCY0891291.1 ATP-dependent DNA helicase [Pyrobaculum arsenaticum]NYR15360.1 ATP-dependent DNA helicase [Pyrobaculum arsenaticum]